MDPEPGTETWYAQVIEEITEPERHIIDPHHHLWFGGGFHDYLLEDLWKDTSAGHRVEKTVFIECGVAPTIHAQWQVQVQKRLAKCAQHCVHWTSAGVALT